MLVTEAWGNQSTANDIGWTAIKRRELMKALVIALVAAAALTACTTTENTASGRDLNELRTERREAMMERRR
jgi:predicted small secreted protein